MTRKSGMGTSQNDKGRLRPVLPVAVVGVVVGGMAIVGRTIQASFAGDAEFVRFQITGNIAGGMAVLILVLVFSSRFIPGEIRARELRRLYPDDLVIAARMNPSARRAILEACKVPRSSQLSRVTIALKADLEGVSFWGGAKAPFLIASLPWSTISGVHVAERLVHDRKYAALEIECSASESKAGFRVSSERRFGLSLLGADALASIAERVETLREQAAGQSQVT